MQRHILTFIQAAHVSCENVYCFLLLKKKILVSAHQLECEGCHQNAIFGRCLSEKVMETAKVCVVIHADTKSKQIGEGGVKQNI